uniref:Cytochrome P450 n=1 Tax=Oryzias melastigma TaxID=30732 RepID=A0A3B3CSC9_ORYME
MELSTSLILVALTAVLLWLLNLRNNRKHRLPPGPPALPLIGNLLQLDKHAPFRTIVETYGPVMTIYTGWQRTVALVGYDAVKEALVDQADDFVGRAPLPFIHRATRGYGESKLLSNGERWRQLRRFALTTLRDFGMGRKGMEQWIQEESGHLIDHINKFKGKPFDPTFVLSCTVSNVICCLVYGERFDYDDKQFSDLLEMTSAILVYSSAVSSSQLYNLFPWLMERLPGRQHTVFGYIEDVRKFAIKKIQEHKDTLDPNSPRDFIDCFLIRMDQEKNNPTSEFHYENLVATVLNLFLAGTETTSSTIRYALKKMQEEIDTVIGRERCACMEDKKSLPFTDAVIHEVQRFMDLTPFSLPHYSLKDISFRGYTIPKVLYAPTSLE